MNQVYSRRKFIKKSLLISSASLGAGLLLDGCNSESTSTDKKEKNFQKEETKITGVIDHSKDSSGVSQADLQKRKQLGYVEKSPIQGSNCSNCALYLPPKAGKEFGGCQLFKGAVLPTAYCTYWVAPQK